MMPFDANALIALGDTEHVHREAARAFFQICAADGWATCPLTEHAFLRILGHRNYPKGPGSPNRARLLLRELTSLRGHQFWQDDVSLLDMTTFPELPSSGKLTDFHLLALAVKRGGKLATFDRRIDPALLPGGAAAYHLIPA